MLIGGQLFSPDDVEHGILRANTAHPSQQAHGLIHYFPTHDIRIGLAVSTLDPRLHFILNCGATSCPPIAILSEDNIEEALSRAAQSYLDSEVDIDVNKRTLYLPKLLLWYGNDFSTDLAIRVGKVIELLGPVKRVQVTESLRALGWDSSTGVSRSSSSGDGADGASMFPFEVVYKDYNWAPNIVK